MMLTGSCSMIVNQLKLSWWSWTLSVNKSHRGVFTHYELIKRHLKRETPRANAGNQLQLSTTAAAMTPTSVTSVNKTLLTAAVQTLTLLGLKFCLKRKTNRQLTDQFVVFFVLMISFKFWLRNRRMSEGQDSEVTTQICLMSDHKVGISELPL